MRRRARDLHLHDFFTRAEIAVAREQMLQRQHLVHHDAEREQIDAPVDRLALELLRRQVGRLSLDGASRVDALAALRIGDAEVEQLHAPAGVSDDVRRRDVAVDDVQRAPVASRRLWT